MEMLFSQEEVWEMSKRKIARIAKQEVRRLDGKAVCHCGGARRACSEAA